MNPINENSQETYNSFVSTLHETFSMPTANSMSSKTSKLPILLEIWIHGRTQYFCLNSDEYSSYSYEQEVLLQEGIKYKVESVER